MSIVMFMDHPVLMTAMHITCLVYIYGLERQIQPSKIIYMYLISLNNREIGTTICIQSTLLSWVKAQVVCFSDEFTIQNLRS